MRGGEADGYSREPQVHRSCCNGDPPGVLHGSRSEDYPVDLETYSMNREEILKLKTYQPVRSQGRRVGYFGEFYGMLFFSSPPHPDELDDMLKMGWKLHSIIPDEFGGGGGVWVYFETRR